MALKLAGKGTLRWCLGSVDKILASYEGTARSNPYHKIGVGNSRVN
jgi:hypothetical protein